MTLRRLLLVGGGHSHVEVLRQQAHAADPGVAMTLVSPALLTPYSGMLPGLVAGHYGVEDAHIALAAVAPTPLLADAAGAALAGQPPTEESFAQAARLAQEAARPISDVRGTQAFRRHLVGVLVRRALRGAAGRAKGGVSNA